MKQTKIKVAYLLATFFFMGANYFSLLQAQTSLFEPVRDQVFSAPVPPMPEKVKEDDAKKIFIRFEGEGLIDVINFIAGQKGVNVIFPPGAPDDKLSKTKVTIRIEEKFTIDEAWDFLETLLNVAGFSLVPRGEMFALVAGTNPIQEPLPLYVNVHYTDLPETDEFIRCIFYLSNVQLKSDTEEGDLNKLLKALLGEAARTTNGAGGKFTIDKANNALIIADRARMIKSVMHIVFNLDRPEFREKYEIIPLFNAVAEDVAGWFNKFLFGDKETGPYYPQRYPATGVRRPAEANYFSKNVRILSESRLNILLVFGREQAVDRLVDFIKKYVDVEPESERRILHVYQVQYLDAEDFASVLTNIVSVDAESQTTQARVVSTTRGGSVERYFFGPPKIMADKPSSQVTTEGVQYSGGNNLLIAARPDDWVKLKRLIEELDVPMPQVVLEVLVADLAFEDYRLLGSLLRNPMNLPLPNDMQFESAQLGRAYYNDIKPDTDPKTVALYPCDMSKNDDLLQLAFKPDGTPVSGSDATESYADIARPGSTLVSLSDPNCKTWGIMQVYKLFSHRKIISHPHVIAAHNQLAHISIGESRLVKDVTTTAAGGSGTQITYKWISANLDIEITPRISIDEAGGDDRVQLSIKVTINDFKRDTDADYFKRTVQTTALVRSQGVLPLGGLVRLDANEAVSQTPILGRIPILGYLFKKRNSEAIKTNLTVFVCPTVIRPRFRWNADEITKDYIKLTKQYAKEGTLFETLQDPITRWFFKTGETDVGKVLDVVEEFTSKDTLKDETVIHRLQHASRSSYGSEDIMSKESPMKISCVQKKHEEPDEIEHDSLLVLDPQEQEERLKSLLAHAENPMLSA